MHALISLNWRMDIEMNPATVVADKAALLREAGINRVSIGVQSWDNAVLKASGAHTMRKRPKNRSKSSDLLV